MALPQDLLEQAIHLCERETVGPPRQASLRRGVSTAYYAVFHLLTAAGAAACSPASPALLRKRVQRAYEHGHMKRVCSAVSSGGPLQVSLLPLLAPATTFSPEIRQIARTFLTLQEARHTADYDTSYKHSRSDVDHLIVQANDVFVSWSAVNGSPEANVFLAALLLQDRWGR